MNSSNAYMTVSGIEIDVVHKEIKNLHISVYPPMGRVRVAAPHRIDWDTVRRAVIHRLSWIKGERERFQNAQRQTPRKMVSGETHYVWGKRYLLDVSKNSGNPKIELAGNTLWIYSPEGSSAGDRFNILDRWYRRELKKQLPELLGEWGRIMGVKVNKYQVKRMKTKWGTCNPDTAALWFNPELAKKNPRCLEYIVVHELTHLLERSHNERFIGLMNQFLPDWEARRDELNDAPLAAEEW
ncbi:M48 family metallopeptidase [Rothia dentocariosa]|jgi:hypothetical protein|uniref:M48 family metallopeptidase n=1 Tax=Rothia dentocariosa TaxID=2047 RepID=UPI0039A3E0E3